MDKLENKFKSFDPVILAFKFDNETIRKTFSLKSDYDIKGYINKMDKKSGYVSEICFRITSYQSVFRKKSGIKPEREQADLIKSFIDVISNLKRDMMNIDWKDIGDIILKCAEILIDIDGEEFCRQFIGGLNMIVPEKECIYDYTNLIESVVRLFIKRGDYLFIVEREILKSKIYYETVSKVYSSYQDITMNHGYFMQLSSVHELYSGFYMDNYRLDDAGENYTDLNTIKKLLSRYSRKYRMYKTGDDPSKLLEDGTKCVHEIMKFYKMSDEPVIYPEQVLYVRYIAFFFEYIRQTIVLALLLRLGELEPKDYKLYYQEICALIKNNIRPEYAIFSDYSKTNLRKNQITYGLIHFAKLLQITGRIERLLIIGNNETPSTLCYYTTVNTFLKMLPENETDDNNVVKYDNNRIVNSGRLALMHVEYMNDPNEGRTLLNYLNIADASTNNARCSDTYIKCFSPEKDDLPMWSMYGDDGNGCCLVIDLKKTIEKNRGIFPLYRVCYIDPGRIEESHTSTIKSYSQITNLLEALKKEIINYKYVTRDYDYIIRILSIIRFLFKNKDYSYENEYRIIYCDGERALHETFQLDLKSSKFPAFPKLYKLTDGAICLNEVIIGPKLKKNTEMIPYLQEKIDKMCEHAETSKPDISFSKIKYR